MGRPVQLDTPANGPESGESASKPSFRGFPKVWAVNLSFISSYYERFGSPTWIRIKIYGDTPKYPLVNIFITRLVGVPRLPPLGIWKPVKHGRDLASDKWVKHCCEHVQARGGLKRLLISSEKRARLHALG